MSVTNKRASGWMSPVRAGVFTAVAIAGYAVLVQVVLKPLHGQETLQSLLGFLNGLDRLVQSPGTKATYLAGFRTGHHVTVAAWCVSVIVSSGFYGLAAFLGRVCWQRFTLVPCTARQLVALSSTDPTGGATAAVVARRRFLSRSLTVLGAATAGSMGYGLVVEPRWFGITRRVVRLRGLPVALAGLRAVQLTDLHHGPWLSRAYLRRVVEATNALRPDLVLLTGDYVDQSAAYIKPVVEELARLQPRIATVAVLGNHDWWEDAPLMRREFAKTNILLLDNARRVLTTERRLEADGRDGLVLAGVGDLMEDKPDYDRALGGLPLRLPRLLLAHNPDVAEEPAFLESGLRVDLIVSGHTHGGQVWLPGLGTPMIPSRYGQKYAQGLVQGPRCPVFISRGLGTSMLPLRVGVSPEIAVLEFQSAAV